MRGAPTAKDIDAYVAAAPKEARKALEEQRRTIRFQSAKPLPALLVKRIVKARIAENALLPRRR